MADTCIPSLIVIDITTEQLVTNVSIIIVYCLRLFVVYKHVMLQGRRQWWVTRVPSLTVISTAVNQLETNISLLTICCLRLCVVVYIQTCNILTSKVVVGSTCLIVIGTIINHSGMLRLYKIFQQAVPPVSDLRLMCHLLNNCSLYMSTILIYLLSINIGNN